MEQDKRKLIIVGRNQIPADDLVKYLTSLAVINKYMRHAMTADKKIEGGEKE